MWFTLRITTQWSSSLHNCSIEYWQWLTAWYGALNFINREIEPRIFACRAKDGKSPSPTNRTESRTQACGGIGKVLFPNCHRVPPLEVARAARQPMTSVWHHRILTKLIGHQGKSPTAFIRDFPKAVFKRVGPMPLAFCLWAEVLADEKRTEGWCAATLFCDSTSRVRRLLTRVDRQPPEVQGAQLHYPLIVEEKEDALD